MFVCCVNFDGLMIESEFNSSVSHGVSVYCVVNEDLLLTVTAS